MAGRRKITEEAEQAGDGEEEESTERVKHTQRMPGPLDGDLETWADEHGMSKNAAINFAVRELVGD